MFLLEVLLEHGRKSIITMLRVSHLILHHMLFELIGLVELFTKYVFQLNFVRYRIHAQEAIGPVTHELAQVVAG